MPSSKRYAIILIGISVISFALLYSIGYEQIHYFKSFYSLNKNISFLISSIEIEDLNQFILSKSEIEQFSSTMIYPTKCEEFDLCPNINKDVEEFTIVIITYNRKEIILKLLKHLSGLSKVNQLLLIWNEREIPNENIHWPSVSYKLRVLHNGNNTLHNRFLPLSIIKTEAIFSLDDDSFVDQETVIKAFKIWQENRDRIVGFVGRGVKWNSYSKTWIYDTMPEKNSISLVLTGGAFIHRKYLGLYTYGMPPGMREHIDKIMNCEDLAMNFLVSNLTHKPPVFVKHPKSLRCPECPDIGLWTQQSHFEERNNCITMFVKMFGYLPLYTQDALI